MAEFDVYRRQSLTSVVRPRAVIVKTPLSYFYAPHNHSDVRI